MQGRRLLFCSVANINFDTQIRMSHQYQDRPEILLRTLPLLTNQYVECNLFHQTFETL